MDNAHLAHRDWLMDNLARPGLKIIETPWKDDHFNRAHIKNARCLPWHCYLKANDAEGNRQTQVMDATDFQSMMAKLGINSTDEVVAYDDYHGLFASRFWWVCRYYGFQRVRILDGGWHGWIEKGLPVEVAASDHAEGSDIEPRENSSMRISMDDLRTAAEAGSVTIWDTRRAGEYDGTEKTSNKRRGHIPGAIHLEWLSLLQEEAYPGGPRFMRPMEEIGAMLASAGLDKGKPIVTHCQASIRATVATLVLEMLGYDGHMVYDEAMAEWANRDDTPLNKGKLSS
jgi:thiosulfate/3-mercaptopyruvate sulfurtransferase